MSGIVQEKFQVDYAQNGNDNSHSGWVSDKSARVTRGAGDKLNRLPPGMNIKAQRNANINDQRSIVAGSDEVTTPVTADMVARGFVKLAMRPTDDMYTREHNDAFYDDVGGFVERNNMLDRL